MPIVSTLDRSSEHARLDLARLAAIAGLVPATSRRSDQPVQCEENGHWITIHETTYRFQGKQATVVRLLYEAWDNGGTWKRVHEILEEAGSRSLKIRQLFKGNPNWTDVIETRGGNCRLRVDREPS